MNLPHDHALTIEPLTETECFERLRLTPFGRVALSSGALPVIFPIHFALMDRNPVFRTDPGTKLMAASNGQVLCLEIDEIHPVLHTGWSVLVTGRADVLTDSDDLLAARRLPLRPWTGDGNAYVRIDAALVSGREIRLGNARKEHAG
ncbi:pyridoxamine 5'-phosphate oxidase family protein [Aquihabitans daechungensis]|uniref:pyridoxamine 5'-phosphate oxidase family protein n=1 Tax=Aquihabitans daechungensis TaxID=1052257 RepID=UPI003BA00FED